VLLSTLFRLSSPICLSAISLWRLCRRHLPACSGRCRTSAGDACKLRRFTSKPERNAMARKNSGRNDVANSGKRASAGVTDEERAAIREHAQELKAEARRSPRGGNTDAESDVLAKIAAMPALDRMIGERLHALIKASAPSLSPRLWYGMPAYANKDGV